MTHFQREILLRVKGVLLRITLGQQQVWTCTTSGKPSPEWQPLAAGRTLCLQGGPQHRGKVPVTIPPRTFCPLSLHSSPCLIPGRWLRDWVWGEIKNKVGTVASGWVVHLHVTPDFLKGQNRTLWQLKRTTSVSSAGWALSLHTGTRALETPELG